MRTQNSSRYLGGPTRIVWVAFCILAVFFTAFAWSGLSIREIIDLMRR